MRAASSPLPTADAARDLSIDRLRGALVVLMVAGNYLSGVQLVPAFLKHAPDVGLTVADLVAPCFVFVIGLNFGPSFVRRATNGLAAASRHATVRYLALIGIGSILAAGQSLVTGPPTYWGVLQALGTAGLLALLVVRLPTAARFAVGLVLLVLYQWGLANGMLEAVRATVQGGLFGALSWGALLILATAVADVWRRGTHPYLLCCGLLAATAVVSAMIVPVSKVRVSLSYVLISLAVSAVAFLLVTLGSRLVADRPGYFAWWGENSLALYLVHLIVLALVVLPDAPGWYAQAPLWLVALQLVAIMAVMSAVAWLLHRRRLRLAL